jgi:hypothetical protein
LLLHLGWNAPLAFSFPHIFNIELSTFLKPCVSLLLEALCYSSSGALPSFGDGVNGKWGEHIFNVEFSTFFKPCVSHLLDTLCYSSSGALPSFGDGVSGKWGERSRRGEVSRRWGGVGRRGKFWSKERC